MSESAQQTEMVLPVDPSRRAHGHSSVISRNLLSTLAEFAVVSR
jgi:hypothetical protein